MLLYPGQPAGINGFVPSIRLKLYREAMEDYEYMVMAANPGNEKEVDKNVNEVVTRAYWEKACLDGTPDLRYKSNSKIEEYTVTYECKKCSRVKKQNRERTSSY